jgi:hypothetical protein
VRYGDFMDNSLSYPIGRFAFDETTAAANRQSAIDAIAGLPAALETVLAGLDEQQVDTPYRPDGWTVRQLVHHIADSHMNAYMRFRLALTEQEPSIKGYDEKAWAELADSRSMPVTVSVQLLSALHARWAALLAAMQPEDFTRTLVHPVNGKGTLERYTALYAWHGTHHVAHIQRLRDRTGW